MSSGNSSQTHKFIVYSFSGWKEKFQEWKVKTLSLSRVHKVHRYLMKKLVIPTEQEAENKGDSSSEYKLYEGNVKAYDLLVRSCTGIPLGLVESVKSGNAYEAWEKLLSKYETTKEDVQALKESWNSCRLEGLSTDPVEWFLKLDRINRLLESIDAKYKKDDVQLAGHMLNNVGKDYAAVVTSIEASGKTNDVEAIQDSLERHWKKHQGSSGKGGNEAFVAENKFTGTCNYCKKPGHKWADCFKRKADMKKKDEEGKGTGKGNLKCWICNGPHKKKDCPKYKGRKSNEVNTLYEDEMFLCEYVQVETPSVEDVEIIGEVNLSVPVVMEERELIGSNEPIDEEANNEVGVDTELVQAKDSTEQNSALTVTELSILIQSMESLNGGNENDFGTVDIGNGYIHLDIEHVEDSDDSSYYSASTSTMGTMTETEFENVDSGDESNLVVELVDSSDESSSGKVKNKEVHMNEEMNNNKDKGNYSMVIKGSGTARQRLIPRLATCQMCEKVGLYLDPYENCGSINEDLDPKPDDKDISEEGKVLSHCHRCGKVNMFACRCECGGYCLVPVKKDNALIGSQTKCSRCNQMGTFGKKCRCGGVYMSSLHECDAIEQVEMNMVISSNQDKEFLADTGATTHIVKEEKDVYKIRRANLCGMKVGTGAVTRVTAKGELTLEDMNDTRFTLHKVHVVPGITRNIISITQMLHKGWQLGGTREELSLSKDGRELIFEREESSNLYFI